jgi:transposase
LFQTNTQMLSGLARLYYKAFAGTSLPVVLERSREVPSLTQGTNETTPAATEFAALIGLDWAHQTHVWALEPAAGGRRETAQLDSDPASMAKWAQQLEQRFAGRPVAVALEQKRGAVIWALSQYPHLVLFPVNSTAVKGYREAFRPSKATDDGYEAGVLLEILRHRRNQLQPWRPESPETRLLQLLVERRRHLVDERTAMSNRLTDSLRQTFPQVLNWFDNLRTPIVYSFLERWPTLCLLQQESAATLHQFLREHRCRLQTAAPRVTAMLEALPVTRDEVVLTMATSDLRWQVKCLRQIHQVIQEIDQEIERRTVAHPEHALFAGLPSAGPAMLPRLIVAFGTDRSRFASAANLQAFAGVAPVRQQSGKLQTITWRRSCPTFLRQTFVEWAGLSTQQSAWAKAFYDHQRANGKTHHAATRALAFKWIRILFRCWKDRQPYNEAHYQQRLLARHAPRPTPSFEWKSCGTFSKPILKNRNPST